MPGKRKRRQEAALAKLASHNSVGPCALVGAGPEAVRADVLNTVQITAL